MQDSLSEQLARNLVPRYKYGSHSWYVLAIQELVTDKKFLVALHCRSAQRKNRREHCLYGFFLCFIET